MEWEDTHAAGRDRSAEEKKRHLEGVRWVTLVQILTCLLLFAAAVILRMSGGELYQTVRDWYRDTVNHSVVVTGTLEEEVKAAGAQLIAFLDGE